MNMIGIVLAVGPGIAPTIGGLILEFSTWQGIFPVMVGMGLAGIGIEPFFALRETAIPDLSRARARPAASLLRQAAVQRTRHSGSADHRLCGRALYMLATVLPFVLIDEAG